MLNLELRHTQFSSAKRSLFIRSPVQRRDPVDDNIQHKSKDYLGSEWWLVLVTSREIFMVPPELEPESACPTHTLEAVYNCPTAGLHLGCA